MPEKVRAFKASDGQLFLDGGSLVTHELKQTIVKALAGQDEIDRQSVSTDIAAALTENHAALFDALKLLRSPKKRTPKSTAAPVPASKPKPTAK